MNTAESAPEFRPEGRADVAIVVVTYNSCADLDGLIASVREEARHVSIRLIIADNSSSDDSLMRARAHSDVVVVSTGGNLGYAGGINVAMRRMGDVESILILNPDLRIEPGAVARLLTTLRGEASIGAVVPRMLDADGNLYLSLRREPTLLRAAADAVLGRRWIGRPAPLSEYVRTPSDYVRARDVDWATGAAIMVRASVAEAVGEWDERFFLYSEETDYLRRVRVLGWRVRYEPEATVVHRRGGSGVSDELTALTVVNRVRYAQKHHPRTAGMYRLLVRAGEQLRRADRTHDRARWALARVDRWALLPRATYDPLPVPTFPEACVIIPAHNEAAVIDRTLAPLSDLAAAGRIEVIVSCNGCSDDTAARAAARPGVRVIESPIGSKVAAIDAAERVATMWPRVYLDADVVLSPRALAALVAELDDEQPLAGRPVAVVDAEASSRTVRRYQRARERMPSLSTHLWGAGIYALNAAARARFDEFPKVIADDVFVDEMFAPEEKRIVATDPVIVQAPRDSASLIGVLTRARRGPAQQGVDSGRETVRELGRSVRGPASAADAVTYLAFAGRARLRARRTSSVWERDDSTRIPLHTATATAAAAAAAPMITPPLRMDHVVLTRFNLPTPGPESLIRAQEGWLRNRIALFERYTVPSMKAQSTDAFTWVVYVDPLSPTWLLDSLAVHEAAGVLHVLPRESVTWRDAAADARAISGAHGDLLVTTNLDNDDAVGSDFIARIQQAAQTTPRAAIYLRDGLVIAGDEVYLRRDPDNAFCSVSEPWSAEPLTAWRDWHTMLHRHLPAVSVSGEPGWLQVIHGQNVSNRARGRRVSPRRYDARFPGLLDTIPVPSRVELASDSLLQRPLRAAVDTARGAAKATVLAVAGKDGLDSVKERLARVG